MSNYEQLILKLDTFIKKYYLNQIIRGLLIAFSSILACYLVVSLLEYNLYFSTSIRKIILVSFLGLTAFFIVKYIAIPLFQYLRIGQSITHEDAATIIGKHFSNVKDKLLNILQLNQQSQNTYNKDLIEASINQKIDGIKLVPFTNAINIAENKKYLKYLLPILLSIVSILLIAPHIFKESNQRLIAPNTTFAKKAPFDFVLINKSLKAIQYENIDIQLKINGKTLPKDVFIIYNNEKIKMEKDDNDKFHYTFNNIQNDMRFNFEAASFTSDEYKIQLLKKPIIANYSAQINYPSYTNKKSEKIENAGDLVVPVGTTVTWNINTENTDNITIKNNHQNVAATKTNKTAFQFQKRIMQDDKYVVYISNKDLPNADSMQFNIVSIPDNYPNVQCNTIIDSSAPQIVLLSGAVSDDYGISKLEFVYRIFDDKGKMLLGKRRALNINGKSIADFNYTFNINEINLQAGQSVEYFIEAFDNDAVHGPKSSKSSSYQFKKQSIQELEKQEYNNNEDIKDELANAQSKATQLANQIKEMKQKLLSKNNLNWEDKKAIESLKKQQQDLLQEMKSIEEKYAENLKNQDEIKKVDDEILKKQEKIQELMKDLMNDELKDLMKQIEEMLQKMQQKNAFENLDKMQMSNQNLNKELEKMQELFKQLQLEQKAQETIQKLNDLAEEQKKLAEQNNLSNNELKDKQDKLNDKFENVKENLKQLDQINKENNNKLDIKQEQQQAKEVEQNMDESAEQLEQNQKQKAQQKQKKAADEMKEIADNLQNKLDQSQADQNAEDIQLIRQLLENLLKLSFEQEQLMKDVKKAEPQSPKYVQLMQRQAELKEDADMIADSLQTLGKRQFQIQNFIADELYKLNREMKKSLEFMQERYVPQATTAQQFVMTHTNNLALMLSESLDNLQQQQNQMKQKMSGDGSCNKPNSGKGNKPSLKQLQDQLGNQLKDMQQKMKEGKQGKQMSKEFAEAAEKQAMIREALRQMKEKLSQEEKNKLGIDDLMNKAEENEKDLITKNLTQKTINRQKEIETRLLEFDKAKREQGEDEKKQSTSGKELPNKLPPALEQYLQQRKSTTEMYKSVPPSLQPFYKSLVDKYFKSIQ
jgi:plastocyanin